MKLDEVAERFALDDMFAYYPIDSTFKDLEQVANSCTDYFDADDWTLAEDVEDLAYVSASAILQEAYDRAWSFKRYYEMVGE